MYKVALTPSRRIPHAPIYMLNIHGKRITEQLGRAFKTKTKQNTRYAFHFELGEADEEKHEAYASCQNRVRTRLRKRLKLNEI